MSRRVPANLVDITGQRFGRVLVLGKHDTRPGFRCRCDCGGEFTAAGHELRRGALRSCGCLRAEQLRRHWHPREVETLRALAGTHTAAQIGARLGRTTLSVRRKARQMGVSLRTYGERCPWAKYSDHDCELARQLHEEGVPPSVIADKLEVPYWAVQSFVYFKRAS